MLVSRECFLKRGRGERENGAGCPRKRFRYVFPRSKIRRPVEYGLDGRPRRSLSTELATADDKCRFQIIIPPYLRSTFQFLCPFASNLLFSLSLPLLSSPFFFLTSFSPDRRIYES